MSALPARLLIFLVLILPCSVEAGTFVVDTTVDAPALTACDDVTPNDCSLRGAILAANALPAAEVSTIEVPAGTYVLSQSSTCTYTRQPVPLQTLTTSQIPLCLSGNTTLQGAGAAGTIIDGNHLGRVVFVSAAAIAEIRGVTITNGIGDRSFGLIPNGGGINNQGTLTLTDCVVSHNTIDPTAGAAGGAGICNDAGAPALTLVRTAVAENVAPSNDSGGGILNNPQAVLTVRDSTIADNVIGTHGGGICNYLGTVTIINSTVSGNTANVFLGGGIANFGGNFIGTLTVINSTISGNTSGSSGGGLYNHNTTDVHLNNVTITDNTGAAAARGDGGGVANDRRGGFVMRNTVIAGNHTPIFANQDCSNGTQLTSEGHNLVRDTTNCAISGDLTGNLLNVDPKFGVLADNGGPTRTHGLQDGSPAIDAGNSAAPGSGGAACVALDQRGFPRPQGVVCDIGAYERFQGGSSLRILPNTGGNTGSVMAIVYGFGVADGATVKLRRTGQPDILGDPVASGGTSILSTNFNLAGKPTGAWDVVVANPDAETAILPAGFTVEAPRPPELFATVVGRSAARPGLAARFAVVYGNRGNTDAMGVPITLGLPASFARHFAVEVAAPPEQPSQPFNDYSDVPLAVRTDVVGEDQVYIPLLLPIVPAGFTGTLAFTVTPPLDTNGTEFGIEALVGEPWFADGAVRPEIVADAAARAREFATAHLGVTAGPELDPALIAYETEALDLAVASARDDLVTNFGQIRRVYSLAYFAIDLAGYVQALTLARVAPVPVTRFAALAPLGRLAALPELFTNALGLGAGTVEAQTVCPPCVCGAVIAPGCSCPDCKNPPPKDDKKPPSGLTPAECMDIPHHIVSADGTSCKPSGSKDCPKGIGSPFSTDPLCRTYPIRNSHDPNDKAGSGGSGPERFVQPGAPMPYLIAFENLPAATAAAQTVVVTDQLDTAVFDLESFALGPILVGDIGITPPPGLTSFSGGADLRPARAVILKVEAGLDKATGTVTWRFTSLDPATLETLTDPDEGFLPPNTDPPAGDGQVHFTILPKAGLASGTEIRNHARVVFDSNAPIDTPEWRNTIDTSAPTSQVLSLASTQSSASFLVEWVGTDDGAGILDYSIFVSVDGGPFAAFLTNTTGTSATFTGEFGKTYAFYSVARDLVGNVEGAPAVADALTVLTTGTPPEACIGDCDDNGMVAINELVLGVNIALDRQSVSACRAFANAQGTVDVAQLVKGVNNALNGCGG